LQIVKCTDAWPLLDLFWDGSLEPKDSALVLDHMKSCDECRGEWNYLEQLHFSFQDTKDRTHLPLGLMESISEKLRDEETSHHMRFFQQYARPLPMVAIAATFALVGLLFVRMISPIDTTPISMQTASADTLVEDVFSEGTLEPVVDQNELAKKVGNQLKYVRLPEWQLDKSGLYKSQAAMPIARFDFVRRGQSGYQRLSCYQAPQGVIQTKAANFRNIEGKRVLFGNHGKFQFALWSRNGRDYLFVTALSQAELEEIVRGA
jgi:hypothetical protein